MHVISRTQCARARDMPGPARTACLAHTDVLALLVLALATASWCCFRVVARTATPYVLFVFVMQAIFCMLACPTLSIALRLAPSTFLAQYVRRAGASVLLRGILGVMLTQTLVVFWYLL
jgi:hypothetical protein